MKSPIYAFLLNMWMMKRLDEAYLHGQVTRGNISQDEMNMIVATPQF